MACVYAVCELAKGFFVVDFLKTIYIPQKIDPLFFVLMSTVSQGRTLCLKGYY